MPYFLSFFLLCLLSSVLSQWIDYPNDGLATMTHYTLPSGYIAACGCTSASTDYPTVALSQMAYGSSTSYGPACGRCFNLTLLNPVIATPPFFPSVVKSIVVKVTDLCPLSQTGWCSGTTSKPNSAGAYLNFDLAYPSKGVPDDFFPSDEVVYGYTDFGVWNVTYQSVPCLDSWTGSNSLAALGSVKNLGSGACCPADPMPGNASTTCPSFSEQNGIPPDTTTSSATAVFMLPQNIFVVILLSVILI
ncbi:RlpA-like double-psi beta-barrel-protein domain-containing protein-containing protein [Gymnopilus junonius]|uniref:RlpA-like double-psi beta-barrel-protein domain-containing protein-containing protein n=1 Tax=Gymnopilus junonius TaxID=109634 RepID=A0A9P5TQV7_GYMJU|nr:RlpA-like double-psi beta-barrel-protein domain-containing protein-containing protein [Gymnopilus junonius]